MALALKQARLAQPHPNPRVGAVVVLDGRVVAVGHHDHAGGPHAEVVALARAGDHTRGGTLYVTLEPCNHHGRTPPCVDAIAAAGIRRVVAAYPDPNPRVRGGGLEALQMRGIEAVWGASNPEVEALLSAWMATLPRMLSPDVLTSMGRVKRCRALSAPSSDAPLVRDASSSKMRR